MRKRATLAIFAAFTIIALLVAVLIPREPTYEGRTMAQWLPIQDRAKADEALVILATNNFPLLLRRISYDRRNDHILRAMAILPARLRSGIASRRATSHINLACEAAAVLSRIGTNSAPLLPQLAEIAAGDGPVFLLTQPTLARLGDEGLAALACIASTNLFFPQRAVALLGEHPESKVARQAFTNLLNHPDPQIRSNAYLHVTNATWYTLTNFGYPWPPKRQTNGFY